MKNVPLLIFLCLFLSCSNQKKALLFSYFKGNGEDGLHLAYSEDGLKWEALNNDKPLLKPQIGQDKLMRDPCIIMGPDNVFHMVWTISWGEKGIGYANSKDLINWSTQQYIPVMEHETEAKNCWAPELFYDDQKEQYIICWSTTIPGRFPETDQSGDNGYNHRMYYTTTKDFKTFTKTKLFFDKGFNVIDGTIVKNKNNYLMVIKDETRWPPAKNLRVVESNKPEGPYSKPIEPFTVTEEYWAEGPSVVKLNNEWILYFDKYRKGHMGAKKTKDWKHWEEINDMFS
ncbi:glycoside hydrolase family 43 protein [Aureibaculum conchae]|uniref:glycoside hydrolase family 43 protein n=1 Tax=Aureibaculum sp. 2308TA14-22 TaxID=3108392 RepID=UPI00339B36C3